MRSWAELWGCGGLCSAEKFEGNELRKGRVAGEEKHEGFYLAKKPSGEQAVAGAGRAGEEGSDGGMRLGGD